MADLRDELQPALGNAYTFNRKLGGVRAGNDGCRGARPLHERTRLHRRLQGERAIEVLKQAVGRDQNFARAYAALARA